MKKIILLTITIAVLVSTVFSQGKIKAGKSVDQEKSCDISGYISDNDPNGLNVRSVPAKNGAIVTRLIQGEDYVMLDIIGTSGNGWVKITNASSGADGSEFKGAGWVFGSMLGTSTRGYPNYNSSANLYLSASKKSKIVRQIPSEGEVVLLDCSGSWAKVSYKGSNGWLARENQCGNPFTTCN